MLGAVLVSDLGGATVRSLIVETEAYLGRTDPASHAFQGRLHAGNASIYSPPGYWYVYRSYGIHWCANLVVGPRNEGSAVLLRGVIIQEGLEVARGRRGGVADRILADGPGKLCQALAIDRSLDGARADRSPVRLFPGIRPPSVRTTPRIGITKAVDWPLRFVAETTNGHPGRAAVREGANRGRQ